MGSLKFGRWMHVVIAGGALGTAGCTDRTFDFGFGTEGADGSGGSDDTGGSDTGDPDPTDPTSDPTDPTSDPTDPTSDPTGDPPPPPGMPGAPELQAIRFLDNLTLELQFSEPMAPVDAVDPSNFRLSSAFGIPDDSYYEDGVTFYQEPRALGGMYCYEYCNDYCYEDYYCYEYCYEDEYGNEICEEYCYDDCEYGEEYCYEMCSYDYSLPIRPAALLNDSADPTRVQIKLNPGVPSQVCDQFEGFPPEEVVAGLFLHYTDDKVPIVTDSQGEGLFQIGERWALLEQDYDQVESFFPDLSPMIAIDCPF